MHGFYGRYLSIDLGKKTHSIETINDDVYETYLGGKGLASYLLNELNPPGVDPLSAENNLIFTTGPLGGSTIWGSCRYGVYTKSPLTGLFAESYSGGKTPDAIANLLQKIAGREGIGEVLSQGIKHAAKEWDLEDIAVHVKGMEPAGYDPRKLKGMGLAYATSDRGACHLRATFYKPELAGMIPPEQIEGKAELFLEFEDRLTIFDTLVLCRFYRDFYLWGPLEEIIHAVTGLEAGEAALRDKAKAIATLIRRFNLREGMQPEDERLTKALHQPLTDTGQVITEDELEIMLKEYYRLHGWDEMGQPNS